MRRALIHALALAAMGCCPAPPPVVEAPPQPVAIATAAPVAAPEPVEVARPMHLVDLLEPGGALLFHLDLAALRDHPLYGPATKFFAVEMGDLRRFEAKCGLDLFRTIEQVAASMHDFERSEPVIVAKMNVSASRALNCVEGVFGEMERGEILGHPARIRKRYYRRTAAVMANDTLVYGRLLEVRRVLERIRAGKPTAPTLLRDRIDRHLAGPFAFVLETGGQEVERMEGHGVRRGDHLAVEGQAIFRTRRSRSAADHAMRAEREIREGRDELRDELGKIIGTKHPLLNVLEALQVKRRGEEVSVSIEATIDAPMARGLGAIIDKRRMRHRTSEAKNAVGAMARGAMAAFERETAGPGSGPNHVLCKSASPVPKFVPKGTTYTPSQKAGADFETGTTTRGWRCLKFNMIQPHRYQYSYRQGSGYKGPARGGPNPGPNGFEVSAEGDLDGDGKTSLFTRTGHVDRGTGRLIMNPGIFESDPDE